MRMIQIYNFEIHVSETLAFFNKCNLTSVIKFNCDPEKCGDLENVLAYDQTVWALTRRTAQQVQRELQNRAS